MTEQWRVGRHVPHHIYRSDGNTVADEVAVTHRPEDAAQIVADHNRVVALEAENARLRAALAGIRKRYADADAAGRQRDWGVAWAMDDDARQALAEEAADGA